MSQRFSWRQELSQYMHSEDPMQLSRCIYWRTAIGLQDVDGLLPSEALVKIAQKQIEGGLSPEAAVKKVQKHYFWHRCRNEEEEGFREADLVSSNIVRLLNQPGFSLSFEMLLQIHNGLFSGIYGFAGQPRDYNITKQEWVLDGDTVVYAPCEAIADSLQDRLGREQAFSYAELMPEETVRHLTRFISDIWQIHAFGEGNTRTTSVFLLKYLQYLGFNPFMDVFADNAWYFRNALVRANYENPESGTVREYSYLEEFMDTLLYGTSRRFQNRSLRISRETQQFAENS